MSLSYSSLRDSLRVGYAVLSHHPLFSFPVLEGLTVTSLLWAWIRITFQRDPTVLFSYELKECSNLPQVRNRVRPSSYSYGATLFQSLSVIPSVCS
uniref:Uncharacterized protein n=1 Tax=Utricularia reniformis TaxID=192314 RepID=A0A1Y0AZL3_9LAMI|nr:hypothetical protein AEK19_MT0295 [Utricularia reniformis]ART30571.1 hypothetical protein AEK19_MT0295 [Utricularia reniformis]